MPCTNPWEARACVPWRAHARLGHAVLLQVLRVAKVADLYQRPSALVQQRVLQLYVAVDHALRHATFTFNLHPNSIYPIPTPYKRRQASWRINKAGNMGLGPYKLLEQLSSPGSMSLDSRDDRRGAALSGMAAAGRICRRAHHLMAVVKPDNELLEEPPGLVLLQSARPGCQPSTQG